MISPKKLKIFRKKNLLKKKEINIKNYKKIIKNINDIKNMIDKLKNVVFKKFCEKFLSIKLFNFGLIENPLELFTTKLKIRNFLNRKISTIIFKKKMTKSLKKSINMIKSGKILIGSFNIYNPNVLLDREMENKLSILN